MGAGESRWAGVEEGLFFSGPGRGLGVNPAYCSSDLFTSSALRTTRRMSLLLSRFACLTGDGAVQVGVGLGLEIGAGGLALSGAGDGETTDVAGETPPISCFFQVSPPSALEASRPPVPTIHSVLVFGTNAMSRIFELISVSRRIALASMGYCHHSGLNKAGRASGSGRAGCRKAIKDAPAAKQIARRK